ncbi:hypothetical protein N3K66_001060 [Trichothecium roseum]|uniref:Uncharacterized protein n=1 Tax=Trichothecium roseum TaxID=47278 RepID=A0ACC0VDM9_9HYPO|nr:hypothetical protein N3K66_001060 [Trichothecium roseum]
MAGVATEFDKIINDARERKKNEALASRIFSKDRRKSAPSKLKSSLATGGSLASRVGVKKQRASIGARATPQKGDVNGEWTHDLHASVNTPRKNTQKANALSSRITLPGQAPSASASKKANARNAKLASALERMDVDSSAPANANIRTSTKPSAKGLSIKGLAGPFAVMAQNFAPGTTAADVESAMTPIGGEMESCRMIKTKPLVIVEMIFVSREGGERVIETFNDKTADGRTLKVYPKIGGVSSASSRDTRLNTRNHAKDQVVDGTMGFPEPSKPSNSERNANYNRRGRSGRSRGGK